MEPETSTPRNGTPLSGTQAAAVDNASAGLGAKRVNKGGRPRKDGLPNKSDRATLEPAETTPSQVSEDDVRFCREIAESGLQILDKLITRKVYGAVCSINENLEPKAREYAMEVHIGDEDIKLVSNAVGACARKYAFLSRFAPELALVSWSVAYSGRVVTTLGEIKKLAAAAEAMKPKNRRDADTPQADQDTNRG